MSQNGRFKVELTKEVDNSPADGKSADVALARVLNSTGVARGVRVTFNLSGNPGAFFLPDNGQTTTLLTNAVGECRVRFASTQAGMVELSACVKAADGTQDCAGPLAFNFLPA